MQGVDDEYRAGCSDAGSLGGTTNSSDHVDMVAARTEMSKINAPAEWGTGLLYAGNIQLHDAGATVCHRIMKRVFLVNRLYVALVGFRSDQNSGTRCFNTVHVNRDPLFDAQGFFGKYGFVLRQNFTSINITGTSMSTPTTVAKAAPDERPKSIVAVAIATSK